MVVKPSSNTSPHKKATQPKQKPTKKATQPKQKPTKKATQPKQKPTSTKSNAGIQKKAGKGPNHAKILVGKDTDQQESLKEISKTARPESEVVTYNEADFQVREIAQSGKEVLIGPPLLTRFEKARITGARSLQLSLGAPALIEIPGHVKDSVTLASLELHAKALPISVRRVLPNGVYQNIPIDWFK